MGSQTGAWSTRPWGLALVFGLLSCSVATSGLAQDPGQQVGRGAGQDVGAPSRAQVWLLRFEGQRARPGLLEALQIQLLDAAVAMDDQVQPAAGALGQRLSIGVARGQALAADLVLWVDGPDPESGELVLYAVGHNDRRALIEVLRAAGGDGPEVDRALALKVQALLDTQVVTAGGQVSLTQALVPPPAVPPPAVASDGRGPGEAGTAGLALFSEVGFSAPLAPSPVLVQPGVEVGAGVRAPVDGAWSVAVAAGFRYAPGVSLRRAAGEMTLHEVAPGLCLWAIHGGHSWQWLAGVGARLRLFDVGARTASGQLGEGAGMVLAPHLTGGVGIPVVGPLHFDLRASLEVAYAQLDFRVNDSVLLTTRRLRPGLWAGLRW